MLRFLTAGESHGPKLVAILEGLPAGLKTYRYFFYGCRTRQLAALVHEEAREPGSRWAGRR